MDPIHPILPQPLNIPPVTEAPKVGRIDREERRERDRGRREESRDEGEDAVDVRLQGNDAGGQDGGSDDDPDLRRHIDLTA